MDVGPDDITTHREYPIMRAIRLRGAGDLRMEQVPEARDPMAGEVRIRVSCVGICGSDLHTYLSGDIDQERPVDSGAAIIPGHEFAGVIESLGEPVPHRVSDVHHPVVYRLLSGDGRELAPGMRVAVDPAMSCGVCARCVEGNTNLCENLRFCGLYPYDGALCERITVPATCCYPLDAPPRYGGRSLDDEAGAMLEPMGVALHAVRLSKIRPGETVAVIGVGPIGLGIAKFATMAGARVFVTDRYPWRLRAAQIFAGVERTFCVGKDGDRNGVGDENRGNGKDSESRWNEGGEGDNGVGDGGDDVDPVAQVRRWVPGGVDVAIEAAWCDESVRQATEMLRRGGRLTITGIPEEDRLVLRHSTVRRS
ncbi:MAG: alcohol dehydrogenase catalytic domain-containing protein, partial [Planctomycetia bacterium]|nr:alcohol dehydrogenase catalytic domain-containing protein [Planctomycetia bacterium]